MTPSTYSTYAGRRCWRRLVVHHRTSVFDEFNGSLSDLIQLETSPRQSEIDDENGPAVRYARPQSINAATFNALHNLNLTSIRDPSSITVEPIRFTNKVLSGYLFSRQIDCWNSSPSVIRNVDSFPAFKSALFNIDLSAFLRGSAFHC